MAVGDERFEAVSGAIDGVNRVFVTPTPYAPGTLFHKLNGLLMLPWRDDGLEELDPAAGIFQLKITPRVRDRIVARYIEAS